MCHRSNHATVLASTHGTVQVQTIFCISMQIHFQKRTGVANVFLSVFCVGCDAGLTGDGAQAIWNRKVPIVDQKEMPAEADLLKLVPVITRIPWVYTKLWVIPHLMTAVFSHQQSFKNWTHLWKLNLEQEFLIRVFPTSSPQVMRTGTSSCPYLVTSSSQMRFPG